MTIHELKIYGFGKHCNLEISFYDGTNIILGRNESGKSTVASFIRALLYGMPENNTSRERKKFRPGNRDVKYGGEMTFEHMGVLYKVTSEFGESKINDVTILYNVNYSRFFKNSTLSLSLTHTHTHYFIIEDCQIYLSEN